MENNVIYDAIFDIDEKADTIIDQTQYNGGGIDSLKTDMTTVRSDIAELQAKGVVKSVQRGITEKSVDYAEQAKATIPISAVNIEKSILFVEVVFTYSGKTSTVLGTTLKNNFIEINLNVNIQSEISVSWQVIEFY